MISEDIKLVEIAKTTVAEPAYDNIPALSSEVKKDVSENESDATIAHLKHLIASKHQTVQSEEDVKTVNQTTVSASESSENNKTSLKMLDRTRFCSCICLAIIVRWLLNSGIGLLYFQVLII